MSDIPTQTEASLRHDEHVMVSLPNHESMTSPIRQAQGDVEEADVTILQRIAMPLFLFSGVLFLLLFFSWIVILPRFTRFDVAGVSLKPLEMAAYTQQLRAQLTTMEQKRDQLVLPQTDPTYTALKQDKLSMPDPLLIRTALINAAGNVISSDAALTIRTLDVDASTTVVSVTGDVRSSSPDTMTVLAQYIDAVEKMPFVSHLQRPTFTRMQDAAGAFHSPFSMQFMFSLAQ